jgi:hypothetical protein
VNQPVTPAERADLARCAAIELLEVYHLERIVSLLDSPRGYRLRLEYLRVAMNEEEQLAFWSSFNSSMSDDKIFVNCNYNVKKLNKKHVIYPKNIKTER